MELKWFEDFLSLARCMSFSRAANERHITQSALSRRIRQLEDWLGFPVVDRTTTPVRLTPEGKRFLPRAHELIQTLADTRDEIRTRYTEQTGVLSFAASNTLALTFFPDWMRSLGAHNVDLQIRFSDPRPSFSGTISSLIEGESEFLLTYANDDVTLLSELERYPFVYLGTERVLPVSLADDDGKPLHPLVENGMPIRYLGYRDGTFFSHALKRLFERHPLSLTTLYEHTMSAGIKAMVMAGSGMAWLPLSLFRDELEHGTIAVASDSSIWQLQVEIRCYRAHHLKSRCSERFWQDVIHQHRPALQA